MNITEVDGRSELNFTADFGKDRKEGKEGNLIRVEALASCFIYNITKVVRFSTPSFSPTLLNSCLVILASSLTFPVEVTSSRA